MKQYEINSDKTDAYKNYISQTMDITKPKEELLRIHPMFHFFPGTLDEIVNNSLPRRDGKFHLLNTIPGNLNAQKLMQDALKSKNFHLIGITTHMFADTFSHQNFVGFKDEINSMKGFFKKLLPSIGHAKAGYNPDWPALKWMDDRFIAKYSEIDNKDRFLKASEHIFELYCRYGQGYLPDTIEEGKKELVPALREAIGDYDNKNKRQDKRIERYENLIGSDFIEYNKDTWFDSAVSWMSDPETIGTPEIKRIYSWKENYKDSDWYQFQEAVKTHQKAAEEVLSPTFEKVDITKLDIW